MSLKSRNRNLTSKVSLMEHRYRQLSEFMSRYTLQPVLEPEVMDEERQEEELEEVPQMARQGNNRAGVPQIGGWSGTGGR